MEKLTDAVLLKETAPRGTVAIVYGVAGLLIGMLVLGK